MGSHGPPWHRVFIHHKGGCRGIKGVFAKYSSEYSAPVLSNTGCFYLWRYFVADIPFILLPGVRQQVVQGPQLLQYSDRVLPDGPSKGNFSVVSKKILQNSPPPPKKMVKDKK